MKKVEVKLNEELHLEINNNKIIITIEKEETPEETIKVEENPVVEVPKLPVTGM